MLVVRDEIPSWFLLTGSNDAKAKMGGSTARSETIPSRRLTVNSFDVPASTAVDASCAASWSNGIGYSAVRVVAVPILAPFLNIPCHVVQPPCVRLVTPDRGCSIVPVIQTSAIPVLPKRTFIIAPVVQRRSASAAGVLPLSLCWQMDVHVQRSGETAAEILTVIPADVFNGKIGVLKCTWVAAHYEEPHRLCDFGFQYPKTLC